MMLMTCCAYSCTQYSLHTQYMLLMMLMTCCAYSCTQYGLHTQYMLLMMLTTCCAYSCTQYGLHTQYTLLMMLMTCCAYSCTQYHNINMEDGLIFGVVTDTSHSLSKGKEEASFWEYNMSALRANMTDCASRHC